MYSLTVSLDILMTENVAKSLFCYVLLFHFLGMASRCWAKLCGE